MERARNGITGSLSFGMRIFSAVIAARLLPVLFNRATGDDYGYGTYTRAAFQATHSLIPLLAAVGKTVKQYYLSWQGTWFSVAVFSLQPEVFHDRAYVVVVFLMLFYG